MSNDVESFIQQQKTKLAQEKVDLQQVCLCRSVKTDLSCCFLYVSVVTSDKKFCSVSNRLLVQKFCSDYVFYFYVHYILYIR